MLNPFIYAYYNKDFKRAFVRVLKCVLLCACVAPEPEPAPDARDRHRRGSPGAMQYTYTFTPPASKKPSGRRRRNTPTLLVGSVGRLH